MTGSGCSIPSEMKSIVNAKCLKTEHGLGAANCILQDVFERVLHSLKSPMLDGAVAYRSLANNIIRNSTHDATRIEVIALEEMLVRFTTDLCEAIRSVCGSMEIEALMNASERRCMFALDSIGAAILKQTGPYGFQVATELEKNSRQRWVHYLEATQGGDAKSEELALWHTWDDRGFGNECLPIVHVLANALWRDRAGSVKQPSLSRAVLESSKSALWSPGRHLRGGVGVIFDRAGSAVAQITPADSDLILRVSESMTSTGTLLGHRLFRWLVATGYSQCYVEQQKDFRRIVVPGGFSGLGELLGARGGKAADTVHRVLEVLQSVRIDLPHGEIGGLISWQLRKAGPQQRAELAIVLGDALLPDYVTAIPKGGYTARRARMLIPLPVTLPPLVGYPRQQAPQVTMQLLTLIELRENAAALKEHGAVEISNSRWRDLARESGVSSELLETLLSAWLTGDERNPPFLSSPDRGFFTLAVPEYDSELAMLIEAGGRELGGRSAALRRHRFSKRERAA
jgi:hypothetical protein